MRRSRSASGRRFGCLDLRDMTSESYSVAGRDRTSDFDYVGSIVTNVADIELPPSPNGKEVLAPSSRSEWRRWLDEHPDRQDGLWVVFKNNSSPIDGPTYDDLVEEALCFGWIDSLTKRVDADRRIQWYSPRRKGGIWSALNKRRIGKLTAAGVMHPRVQAAIDAAMADGSWSQYDAAEALILPDDLEMAFTEAPEARRAYEGASSSTKKQLLWQIYSAKRADTRAKRIELLIRDLSSDG